VWRYPTDFAEQDKANN